MALSKPVVFHKKLGHKIIVVPTLKAPHYGYYKCNTCDKWLAWANKHTDTEYKGD